LSVVIYKLIYVFNGYKIFIELSLWAYSWRVDNLKTRFFEGKVLIELSDIRMKIDAFGKQTSDKNITSTNFRKSDHRFSPKRSVLRLCQDVE
jgi:hypothetical protein